MTPSPGEKYWHIMTGAVALVKKVEPKRIIIVVDGNRETLHPHEFTAQWRQRVQQPHAGASPVGQPPGR